jgi:hypothetical protein
MQIGSRLGSLLLGSCGLTLAVTLAAACGSEPPPPPETPKAPVTAPEPVATTEPTAAPADSAAPAPDADAGAPKKASSGRPPILKSDALEITDTFGSTPAARLEIGDKELASLRIPENALDRGTNVTFKLDAKGKNGGGLVGKVYRITLIIPPSGTPTKITSGGDPFEIRLPAGNKKDANLAMGEITVDDKGKEKVVWTVVAPTKIDDATATAYFDVPSLGDQWIHVTTKAAGAAPGK